MATRREIRSDIILRLTKGKPSDDFEIDDRQIDFEIDTCRSLLVKAKVEHEKLIDGSLLTYFDNISITTETISGYDSDNGSDKRYYATLPTSVIGLPKDIGVHMITTNAGRLIHRITAMDSVNLLYLKFGKPSKNQIGYKRVNDKIYFEGMALDFAQNGKVTMLLVVADTSSIDDDGEFPLSAELISPLLDMVEEKLRRQLGLPEDTANDGKQ
jgi:hypothetical protein